MCGDLNAGLTIKRRSIVLFYKNLACGLYPVKKELRLPGIRGAGVYRKKIDKSAYFGRLIYMFDKHGFFMTDFCAIQIVVFIYGYIGDVCRF